MDEYCHAFSDGKQVVVSCLCWSTAGFPLNLQDDNGMFRNSLNCICASLTETALLLTLLHCKDTY